MKAWRFRRAFFICVGQICVGKIGIDNICAALLPRHHNLSVRTSKYSDEPTTDWVDVRMIHKIPALIAPMGRGQRYDRAREDRKTLGHKPAPN